MSEQRTHWQPISAYPACPTCGEKSCEWGPEVLVRVPAAAAYPHGPTYYVARLEAGMWLVRDSGEPIAWGDLHAAPDAWMPIEGTE